jgi:hypothetical protein
MSSDDWSAPESPDPYPDPVLRRWAWWAGRTDVIFDLDLSPVLRQLLQAPRRHDWQALLLLLPSDGLDPCQKAEIVGLAGGRATAASGELHARLQEMREAVEDRLAAHAAGLADAELAGHRFSAGPK